MLCSTKSQNWRGRATGAARADSRHLVLESSFGASRVYKPHTGHLGLLLFTWSACWWEMDTTFLLKVQFQV